MSQNGRARVILLVYNPLHPMQIIRSHRKTIALIVERDGSLTVRAPRKASQHHIEQIVAQKARWIKKRQEWVRCHYVPLHQYQENEIFYFLGNPYPLMVVKNQQQPVILNHSLQLDSKSLICAEKTISTWYQKQARQIIPERLSLLAIRHQILFQNVRITSARTRWGSCSSRGSLNFSWRLVMAPMDVIDYVIVHELVHLEIHNHSTAFWNRLGELLPTYPMHRKWLKENGGLIAL